MHSYTLLGKPYVRIAALPTDRFPSDGKSVSAFAKTVLSNLSLRSVLASSHLRFIPLSRRLFPMEHLTIKQ